MPVVVVVLQQRIEDGRENSRFISAEMIAGNQVERGARFRLVVVVPARMIPATTSLDLFRVQAEQEKISSPAALAISMVAPSRVPMVSAPFIMNFMLLVPLAP